ncbi:multidrug efflux pump subunit AcrA (membrane-fusion protein) [Pedobacter sp. UYEF25]
MDVKMKYGLMVLLAATFFSCNSKNKEVKPVVQDIKELVFVSGVVEWDDVYNLTAQTDGVLTNANFDAGNKVVQGVVLASIDNKTNQINTEMAQKQLAIANQNLTSKSPQMQQLQQNIGFAESKYRQDKTQEERYKRMYESESIAKMEYENIALNAKSSLANLNALKDQLAQILQQAKQQQIAIKGQLQNSKVVQNYNQIVVTESGTIIKKLKNSGEYVRKGDIIGTIANDKKIEIVLNVDENSIAKVKIGQTVFVQLNTDKSKTYDAKITEILAAFDEKTQSFICKASFDTALNTSIFGTQLEANILVGEKKDALLIPRSYMGFGNKVNVKGKDEDVIIKTGIVSTDYVEVLRGITKHDILLPLKL